MEIFHRNGAWTKIPSLKQNITQRYKNNKYVFR